MAEPDLDTLRYALSVARNHGYCEVQIASGEGCFEAKLDLAAAAKLAAASAPTVGTSETKSSAQCEVTATLVGYYQPSNPPLQVGQTVQKGDVVAVITALGLANDVEATVSGVVAEVLVQSGQPVEFGQVLARVGE